jgi:outer membrane protein assembly factor BamB
MNRRTITLLAGAFLVLPAGAADWPQWRGPERTGLSKETGLLKTWPDGGPKLLWKADDIGNGYSTPAIAGGRVYLLSNRGDDEFAVAFNAENGNQIWSVKIGKVGINMGPQYPGTRSTPTVDGDMLYCLSSDGDLVCLAEDQGGVKWRKSLRQDFGGEPGKWAYAESPLIDGDKLVCTPGGAKATLVALNKKTGEVIWKAAVPGGDKAAYASITVTQVDGIKQYVQFLQKGVVGVDASMGKFLWRYDKTATNSPANIPTPVSHDGYVFTSTGKGGSGLVKLTANNGEVSAKEVYYAKELGNALGGMVRVGDYLYGATNQAVLCVEFTTGKVKWQDRSVGKGATCYADGNLYVRGESGEVALVEATPAGYKEKGRFNQPKRSKSPAWPHPVIANGCLYLRDQGVLFCYAIMK